MFLYVFFISCIFNDTIVDKADFYKTKYGVNVINSTEKYKAHILEKPLMALVDIQLYIPSIVLDIRYASTNNFTHKKHYERAKAFVALAMVDSLKKIQLQLKKENLGLKIYDAYRPYAVSLDLYKSIPNPTFVAPPQKGSRHNRGCAIDVSIVNLKTKKEILMPTAYDVFSHNARYNAKIKNKKAAINRDKLILIMHQHGFKVTKSEWWHYDFKDYQLYPLLNIAFDNL